jgi:hypothetical protein
MLDEVTVEKLLWHWEEGWNTADLPTIMAPFAPDVVFSSPFVPKLTNDPKRTTIEGYDGLRSYIEYSLRYAPGIRYSVDSSHVGLETLIVVYTCHNPDGSTRAGADSMRVDAAGRVVEWRCHYARAI